MIAQVDALNRTLLQEKINHFGNLTAKYGVNKSMIIDIRTKKQDKAPQHRILIMKHTKKEKKPTAAEKQVILKKIHVIPLPSNENRLSTKNLTKSLNHKKQMLMKRTHKAAMLKKRLMKEQTGRIVKKQLNPATYNLKKREIGKSLENKLSEYKTNMEQMIAHKQKLFEQKKKEVLKPRIMTKSGVGKSSSQKKNGPSKSIKDKKLMKIKPDEFKVPQDKNIFYLKNVLDDIEKPGKITDHRNLNLQTRATHVYVLRNVDKLFKEEAKEPEDGKNPKRKGKRPTTFYWKVDRFTENPKNAEKHSEKTGEKKPNK